MDMTPRSSITTDNRYGNCTQYVEESCGSGPMHDATTCLSCDGTCVRPSIDKGMSDEDYFELLNDLKRHDKNIEGDTPVSDLEEDPEVVC